jgi:Holliday junction resolvase RusA-like endonuclease
MPGVILEFTVPGPPVSSQTANRRNLNSWKERVRRAARQRWDGRRRPCEIPVQVTVTYYHDGPSSNLDEDNCVKPIQDALIGIAYADDRYVTDAKLRKTSIDGRFQIRRLSQPLANAFVVGEEFVHVRIEEAPNHAVLP